MAKPACDFALYAADLGSRLDSAAPLERSLANLPSEDETRHDHAYESVLFAHSSTYRSKYFDPEPSSSSIQEVSVDLQGDIEDKKRCPICDATFARMGDKRRHEIKHKPGLAYPARNVLSPSIEGINSVTTREIDTG